MAAEQSPEQPAYRETGALLEACREWVHAYMVLDEDQGNVLAAWVLHTWAIDAAEYTPYIHITAAEKECGKSRLLETLYPIVNRPRKSAGMSAAALLRILDRDSPTLLLDEVDAAFGENKDSAESIRGVLNAGFQRGGVFCKCVGKSHNVQDFKAFGPKAFAGIGKVPETVASRSIVIEMRRKPPEQRVKSLRGREVMDASKSLVASLEAWSDSWVIEILSEARPTFPDGFGDRQIDISEPLLAIADLAGGEWPSSVRASLLALFRSEASEDSSVGVTLLRDIYAVFYSMSGEHTDRIASAALTSALQALEGSPWGDWDKGRQFNVNALAKRLKPFHIKPQTIRLGGETCKGYMRDSFIDAWKSYLPSIPFEAVPPVTPVTDVTVLNPVEFSPFGEPSQSRIVTAQKMQPKPRQTPIVTAVTPVTGLSKQREPKDFIEGVV